MSEDSKRAGMTRADQWTFIFYGLAATTSLVGQVWAAAEHITAAALPFWAKCLVMVVPVTVIEVFGVAMAGRADLRMRAGHPGVRYLVLSAVAAGFAVVLNFWGHFENGAPSWWSWLFAGVSVGAYVVWLFHSADRRNDAAVADKRKAGAAPQYGVARWVKQYRLTRRARELAQEHGIGLFDSLHMAEQDLRAEERRRLIGAAVRELIRADHKDPRRAKLAEVTYDMDRMARRVEELADYDGWASMVGRMLTPSELANAGLVAPNRRHQTEVDTPIRRVAERETDSVAPGPRRGGNRRTPEPTEEQDRAAAREMWRESWYASTPLAAAELARRFGRDRNPKWGAARIAEVRAAIGDTGEIPIITEEIPEGAR